MCTQNFSLRAKKKFPLFVIPLLLFAVIKVTKGSKSHSSESCSESGENDDNQSGRHHRHHGWKHSRGGTKPRIQNSPTCRMELIETVPEVLVKKHLVASSLPVQHSSTIRSWMKLVDLAKDKVEIITQWGIYNSTGYGLKFYEKLEKAASEDGIRIKIGYNPRVMNDTNVTPRDLRREAPRKVEERMLDIWGMVDGNSGVIHSKMILTDRSHFYIGSANLGNRGTTKTKEVGIMIRDCQLLGEDAGKIFDTYWSVYGMKSLPDSWPRKLSTTINHQTPLRVYNPLDDHLYDVFLSAGPRPMNAVGRSEDLEAILWAMDRASKYIYIAVNEYLPMDVYKKNHYWPVIDERIRAAVKRNVVVKFLMNDLATHKDQMRPFLQKKFYGVWGQDLLKLNTRSKKFIEVRMFKANVKKFHGSHNKFMVTDKSGFIGTSNWTEDYFTTTAGQGFVFEPISESSNHDRDRSETDESRSRFNLRDQLEQIFHRDWTSKMAYPFK